MATCFRSSKAAVVGVIVLCCALSAAGATAAPPRPYVGITPDFGVQVKGMKVRAVTKNGPADKAGVQASDIIIKIDCNEVRNLQDFVAAMRFIRIGKKAKMVLKRDDKTITVTITPVERELKNR